ncbi:hypothetical protein CDD80_4884 [Ophiocordyceps camponoti-rufipedis]|uniref:Cell cycle control protein n=1 Tax=Ophiocordyceps camponoti-rufipedis TaxID=2004952 RepID=A0A2C5Y1J2_9HYPO|nr:hypothetical protein CDD80_4884 [Ophiocordyceps camponoti-rufipedis]
MPAGGLLVGSDDDIVEIAASPRRGDGDDREAFMTNQSLGLRPSLQPRNRQVAPRQDTPLAIIDLTDEPDSPEQQRSQPHLQPPAGRNPRRTNSQNVTPPQLSRSDSTLISPFTSVIDLTDDSPEEQIPPDSPRMLRPRQSFLHHHHRHAHHRHHHHHRSRPVPPQRPGYRPHHDHLFDLELLNGTGLMPNIARGVQRMAAGALFIPDLLRRGPFNVPSLNYAAAAAAVLDEDRDPSPKPPMEVVSSAREGFTRDTLADVDGQAERIVVCPACNEELAYDPSDTPARSSGSRKRKRAPGEHHFWALKRCGHVYCADCFENRKPTKALPNGAGFRSPGDKSGASAAANDLRCVVANCETKIAQKTEWIGIFL